MDEAYARRNRDEASSELQAGCRELEDREHEEMTPPKPIDARWMASSRTVRRSFICAFTQAASRTIGSGIAECWHSSA
jgi:hypothetical protein